MEFVHLNVHSNFSMLGGTRTVDEIVAAAVSAGMDAIALTDTNGLHAVVPFTTACERAGIRSLYGVELTGRWGRGGGYESDHASSTSGQAGGPAARVVLLARSRCGYGEICRIVTRRHLSDNFLLEEELPGVSEQVYIITGDLRVLRSLHRFPNLRAALPVAGGRERERERWRIRGEAHRLGVRAVASAGVWFLEPGEYLVHRVLTAVRTRSTIGTLPPGEAAPPDSIFRTAEEVMRTFRGHEAEVEETSEIARDCRVELDLGRRRLPEFPLPPGEDASSLLRTIAARGLRDRLGPDCPAGERLAAREKISYELSVIEQKGLAAYFLICWDIVRFARSRGMRSIGRGSAGNSLVSYVLGITHFNPLRHNMFFERFLNPERENLPDFDIDFGTDDRETVLKYIFRRYGSERVAMIGTFSTLRARGAIREAARALGIPEGEARPFIKRIPFYASVEKLEHLAKVSPAAAGLPLSDEPFRTLIRIARKIGGFPRHMATHPCGLVVSPEPITNLIPLQRGDKGYEITQWSMYDVETAGLVKIDIIGQKGLAVIEETCSMAEENEGRPLHPERIDYLGDPETRLLLRSGKTEGCFYIESPIMMQLMQQARCDGFEVLTALSSIIRPGVSSHGGKRRYLRRALGLEQVPELHPAIADVLRDTYGCLIYQEQVIRLAVAVAGMSYAEADGLRRCMSFKSIGDETMERYRSSFLRGALGRGIPRETAEEVFGQIASFAGYAFCKAHSASFALESFESAWWKAHYPAEFMAAVLSNGGGYYTGEEYIEEARRIGIELLPPCINESRLRHHGRGRSLRIGLMQVKGLSRETVEAVVGGRPFGSLADFLGRVPATIAETESLIRCGAMACFGQTRPELMWQLRVLEAAGRRACSKDDGGGQPEGPCGTNGDADPAAMLGRIPEIPDYGPERSLAVEREALDICVGAHPLMIYRDTLRRLGKRVALVSSNRLREHEGRRVDTTGWRVTAKATRTTGRGEEMIFVTFSDLAGRFEAVFFPKVYRRVARELFRGRGPFHLRGRVESDLGVLSVTASDISFLGGEDAIPS